MHLVLNPLSIRLTTLVRPDICTLSAEDAIEQDAIIDSTVACKHIFFALNRMLAVQPAIREYKLAQKRAEKNSQRSQNTASQLTSARTLRLIHLLTEANSEDQQQTDSYASPRGRSYGELEGSSSSDRAGSSNRITSGASTLEEAVNSTGGEKILFAKEVTTGYFCASLFTHLCMSVWPRGRIALDWVEGRDGTCLTWADT
jgi:hypothetical protein